MTARALAIAALAAAAGCNDGHYLVVTVEARPAVHDVATLRVTLSNAGSMRTEDLPVGAATFPATFSVSPEDRTGALGLAIEALADDGAVLGRGTVETTTEAGAATVVIDPTDFVVNSELADDQQLSNYAGANGFQLAAAADGTWTAVYNASCATPCNVFARRFDATARPVTTVAGAGTVGFPISTDLTTFFSTPAVATAGATTLVVWNHDDPNVAGAYSIECRALDPAGAASTQTTIAADTFPNIVTVAPLPTGNFAVVWDGQVTNAVVRAAIVRPDCSTLAGPLLVSPSVAGQVSHRSHAAASGTALLYAYLVDGSVRVRPGRTDGTFAGADVELVAKTAAEEVEYLRVVPLGDGFAVIVRWVSATALTGPGRLELIRTTTAGARAGDPIAISDRSGSDPASAESFGVAGRPGGGAIVAWSACMDRGDGSGCGVFGRLIAATGAPAGDELVLASTTVNDQRGPSVTALPDGAFAAAWTDRSGAAPDSSGSSVRARILYPPASSSAR